MITRRNHEGTRGSVPAGFKLIANLVPVASATAAIAATAEVSFDHRFRYVDRQGAATELGSIQLSDRLVSLFLAHGYETEALGTARISIRDDLNRFYSSELLKCSSDIAFCRLKRQISNKQFFRHLYLPNL